MNANPNVILICGAVIVVALIASAVALTLHGSITGAAALAFLGLFVTIGGGIIAHASGVSSGAAAAKSATPPK